MIRVLGPTTPSGQEFGPLINTTSRSPQLWARQLSPFFLGPVPLYAGAGLRVAQNVENAWQYAKVYEDHDASGEPSEAYWPWAREGWANNRAVRYPMGKGAKPAYSWWDGEALSYVEARRRIYVPLYTRAVVNTPAFRKLLGLYRESEDITLWDFDGYDHLKFGMTLKEVLNHPVRKMGHAFVLAMMLEQMA